MPAAPEYAMSNRVEKQGCTNAAKEGGRGKEEGRRKLILLLYKGL